jgi:predicted glycosyltransferase
VVARDWLENGLADYAAQNFDEIWVYGDEDHFDFRKEYQLPLALQRKMSYLGYFPRKLSPDRRTHLRDYYRSKLMLGESDQLVIVTGGGGRDAVSLYRRYLRCLSSLPKTVVTLLVTGPLIRGSQRQQLSALAEGCVGHRVCVESYLPDLQHMLPAADAVVGMGGAGTVLEIVVACCPGVVVPRGIWASGQQARARLVQEQGWLPVLPLSMATPDRLARMVHALLDAHPRELPLRLGGVDRARRRLAAAVRR